MIFDNKTEINLDKYFDAVDQAPSFGLEGKVVKVVGLIAEGLGMGLSIGSICNIENDQGKKIMAEVVGFRDNSVLLMDLSHRI